MDTISISNIGLLFDIAGVFVIGIHSFVLLSYKHLIKKDVKTFKTITRKIDKPYLPEKESSLGIKCDLMVGTFLLFVGFGLQLYGNMMDKYVYMFWFYTTFFILNCVLVFYYGLARRRLIYCLAKVDYPS